MHRIDTANATIDNKFTEGDPQQAIPATEVSDDWLNSVQEEVAGAIEAAGIVLDKGDNTQLAAALAILAANGAGWFTGDYKFTSRTAADAGWLLVTADVNTIGSAASAANLRAHADCENLYKHFWDTFADAECPVTGGRGANAQADWDADKPIGVGRLAGRVFGAAGAGTGLTARTNGDSVGAETHQLTEAEMPIHDHEVLAGSVESGASGRIDYASTASSSMNTESTGGDQAHNNMQPTVFRNVMIKL